MRSPARAIPAVPSFTVRPLEGVLRQSVQTAGRFSRNDAMPSRLATMVVLFQSGQTGRRFPRNADMPSTAPGSWLAAAMTSTATA